MLTEIKYYKLKLISVSFHFSYSFSLTWCTKIIKNETEMKK